MRKIPIRTLSIIGSPAKAKYPFRGGITSFSRVLVPRPIFVRRIFVGHFSVPHFFIARFSFIYFFVWSLFRSCNSSSIRFLVLPFFGRHWFSSMHFFVYPFFSVTMFYPHPYLRTCIFSSRGFSFRIFSSSYFFSNIFAFAIFPSSYFSYVHALFRSNISSSWCFFVRSFLRPAQFRLSIFPYMRDAWFWTFWTDLISIWLTWVFPHWLIMGRSRNWPDLRSPIWKNPRYASSMYLVAYQILKVSNLDLNHCGHNAIGKLFGGWVTWSDLATWSEVTWT